MRARLLGLVFGFMCLPSFASAQAGPAPVTIGDVTVSGSVRARYYSWDWFGIDTAGEYSYPAALVRIALSQQHPRWDWQVEVAAPLVAGLPSDAIQPAPRGQLGLGASYYAANDSSTAAAGLFVKQAVLRLKKLGGRDGQVLTIGRMEFGDAGEVTPKNPTLAALKRDRVSQRLIGTFGFTDVGRSFDGALYTLATPSTTIAAFAARPTEGVFQTNGWSNLGIGVYYGAITKPVTSGRLTGEWRAFAAGYRDARGLVKTDNRPAAVRSADLAPVTIGSYGGHWLGVVTTSQGALDLLLWGVVQNGSWGALSHSAGAFAAEAGWQPSGMPLRPWLRAGYNFGSGDSDAGDQQHGTFVPFLLTPRVYARTPFFNQMNNRDGFGEVLLRPGKKLTLRSDVHALSVASTADLWYQGGGAFQPGTFGFSGRPTSSNSDLGWLTDVSADIVLHPRASLAIYGGRASAGAVPESVYSSSASLRFAYVEMLLRF